MMPDKGRGHPPAKNGGPDLTTCSDESTPPSVSAPAGVPVAEVVKVTPVKETRLVKVACPFCGGKRRRFHVHGWPYGRDRIGLGVSHCRKDTGTYFIAAPAEAVTR